MKQIIPTEVLTAFGAIYLSQELAQSARRYDKANSELSSLIKSISEKSKTEAKKRLAENPFDVEKTGFQDALAASMEDRFLNVIDLNPVDKPGRDVPPGIEEAARCHKIVENLEMKTGEMLELQSLVRSLTDLIELFSTSRNPFSIIFIALLQAALENARERLDVVIDEREFYLAAAIDNQCDTPLVFTPRLYPRQRIKK